MERKKLRVVFTQCMAWLTSSREHQGTDFSKRRLNKIRDRHGRTSNEQLSVQITTYLPMFPNRLYFRPCRLFDVVISKLN